MAAATMLFGAAGKASAARGKPHPPRRSDAHISLHVSNHSVLRGDGVLVRGAIRPQGVHRVRVLIRGAARLSMSLRTDARGAFTAHLGAMGTGSYAVRAYGLHDRRTTGSASPARRLTVYRRAEASYYGPGLYGGVLACGGTLQPGTLGVAHKTLPCGTPVKLRYRGRSITVPVVDRGPYVAGRDFDLTEATKARLGFPSTGVLLASR
ncbi:MAG TPA: septal ring lytic transglycosylase RlpA family protein [Solirubrobacterales bacterium]|nr:septal ring lytic transglycosylase RlpA family protein [Solirubrobacterales bacterium]